MKYDDLTDGEKQCLAEGGARQRQLSGELASLNLRLEDFMSFYFNSMSPVLSKLDAGETVPNSTKMAGSEPLTNDEHATLASYFDHITNDETGINTPAHRGLYVKAAGFENTNA